MNLNQLEYFIAAAETLNFTKAAEQCYISQTAMTQQMKALEKKLGVLLFLRDKHHVELTAAGRVYLKEARIIVSRSNNAIRMARLASEGMEGSLSIGYIRGYGQSDFSDILRNFHCTYPDIKLSLRRNNMSVLMDSLSKNDCDIVFAVSSQQTAKEDIKQLYLKSYPVMAVLHEEHFLAEKETLTYQDLKDEFFIMMQPADRPKDQMEESLLIYKRGGYLPKIAAIEGDPETLLLMVSTGLGISILPEYITRLYKNTMNINIIPMLKEDGSAETVDLYVSWKKDNKNPAVQHLLRSVSKQIPPAGLYFT